MVTVLTVGPTGINLTVETLLHSIVVLLVAVLLGKAIGMVLSRVADRFVRNRFRVMVLIPTLKFLVYGTAVYIIVTSLFELTQTQLIAFAGLLGAAIGLGLKDLLADVVGGLVLVVERPFQVGDKVRIGGTYGEVTDIGLRSTQLLTPTETLAVVPNFTIFNEVVKNANTSDTEMMLAVEFSVDPGADVRRATQIVEEALVTSPFVYVSAEHPYAVEVEDDLHHRTVRGKAYVTELRRESAFRTDVTTRVLAAFDREGIRSPTPPSSGT